MRTIPFKSLRSHYGPILCCNPQDHTNVYAISGDYGHVISNHITGLPENSAFIDIGANYGLFSLLAASHLPKGKVFSFEPNPEIYHYLLTAKELNELENIITLNYAVGIDSGKMELRYNKKHSGVSSLVTNDQKASEDIETFTVEVLNIAENDTLKELDKIPAAHIKIDVEGYEGKIIETVRQAPWYNKVKSIIVEIDDRNLRKFDSSAKSLYKTLEQDGFTPTIGFNDTKHYDEIFVR